MKKTINLLFALLLVLLPFGLMSCDSKNNSDEDLSKLEFVDKSFEYDGDTHAIYVLNLPKGYDVRYENNGQSAPGTYEVVATILKDGKVVKTLKANLTILEEGETLPDPTPEETTPEESENKTPEEVDPEVLEITFASKTFEYDGKAHSLVCENVPEGMTVTYVNNDKTEIGRYEVVAIVSNMNGKVLELKATLTISKEGEPLPEPGNDVYTLEVNGKTYTLKENNQNSNEMMITEIEVKANAVITIKVNGKAVEVKGKDNKDNNVTIDMKVKDAGTVDAYYDYTTQELWLTGKKADPLPEPEPEPTDGTTFYLKPSSNWNEGNARFAIYVFNETLGTNAWYSMHDEDGDGIYEVKVDTSKWEKIIFCRMNPDKLENSWDTKWNQSGDLALDKGNLWTNPDGTWDKADDTNWSTKEN